MFNRPPQTSPPRRAFLHLSDARIRGAGQPPRACLVSGVATHGLGNTPAILFRGLSPDFEFHVGSRLGGWAAVIDVPDDRVMLNYLHELTIVRDKKRIHSVSPWLDFPYCPTRF